MHRQIGHKEQEAGGQLFARIDGAEIIIEKATGPRKSDRRSRYSFFPSRMAERREINKLFKTGLHYVGDWHTHPQPRPAPSRTDIQSFQEMFRRSRHQLKSFVMIIIGSDPGVDGLFVALCNDTSITPLRANNSVRSG
ncbi:MAG: Mov34/MPN/PAD-1 family protein [Candidatus Thiodiazotropha sp. (ex Ctena orbiculata)]|nr:Mov34/MPN/PAD-1 family protein [Candidatus Thiodiazotropha taylori]MBT3035634.1 Mov34/MPN/PAD-1 family protein [Candidatus Thiodiazotropha taylori]